MRAEAAGDPGSWRQQAILDRRIRRLRLMPRPRLYRSRVVSAEGLDGRSRTDEVAHVPDDTAFATKPAMAIGMIERAIAASVPFAWVAADSVYGTGEVEMALRRAGRGYVLGVSSNHHFRSWQKDPPITGTAAEIASRVDPSRWLRLSAGEGTKGARLNDWVYYELADLDAAEYDEACTGLWTRGLLIRRKISDGDLAFFSTRCPVGTGVEK